MNWQPCWLALALSLLAVPLRGPASAQAVLSAKQQEEADIRRELQRIIAEDPAQAPRRKRRSTRSTSRTTSAEGRQARNRRERGARRIVNGLPRASVIRRSARCCKGSDPAHGGAGAPARWSAATSSSPPRTASPRIRRPASYLVFFQELGFFKVKAIQWAKESTNTTPYADLAMLTLASRSRASRRCRSIRA